MGRFALSLDKGVGIFNGRSNETSEERERTKYAFKKSLRVPPPCWKTLNMQQLQLLMSTRPPNWAGCVLQLRWLICVFLTEHFFGRWQYSVLRKVCLFLSHISWSPDSHSAHFFLSAVSKGVSPCTGKVGLALHSPLEFAPSQASHLEGAAIWPKERYNAGGHSWGGPPRGVKATGKGSTEGSGSIVLPSFLHHSLPPSTALKSPLHLPAQHSSETGSGSEGAG